MKGRTRNHIRLRRNLLYHVISEFPMPSCGWATYPGNAMPTAGTPIPPGCWPPNCITARKFIKLGKFISLSSMNKCRKQCRFNRPLNTKHIYAIDMHTNRSVYGSPNLYSKTVGGGGDRIYQFSAPKLYGPINQNRDKELQRKIWMPFRSWQSICQNTVNSKNIEKSSY